MDAVEEASRYLIRRFRALILRPDATRGLRVASEGSTVLYFATVAGVPYSPVREALTRFWDASSLFGGVVEVPTVYSFQKTSSRSDEDYPVLTAVRRATTFCRTLAALVWVFGYRRPIDWRSVILHYAHLDMEGKMIKNIKYHTLCLANKGRQQPAPARDPAAFGPDGILIDYPCLQWMRRMVLRKTSTGVAFAETILLGVKRGAPSLDDASLAKALSDFKTLMSSSPTSSERMLEEVERTVGEIFGTSCQNYDRLSERMSFSNRGGARSDGSAVPVKTGGIRGEVWRWAVREGISDLAESVLEMRDHPALGVVEQRLLSVERDYPAICRALQKRLILSKDYTTVARVASIYEPCKVRVITEGQWDVYAAGKPLQKGLWNSLKRFPCFALTNRPQSESVVNEFLCRVEVGDAISALESGCPGVCVQWKSADFSDATNRLHADICETALKVATGPIYDWLGSKLCGPHKIVMPWGETITQKRGQLMGSMISFPLLCAINAACIRAAFEELWGKSVPIASLPAMINGDDNVFPCNNALLEFWKRNIAEVGFEESPGKSYLSSAWLQINSRTYDLIRCPGVAECRAARPILVSRERSFVNFGIIGGLKKGVVRQDFADLEQLASRTRDQWDHLAGLPGRIWGRAAVVYGRSYLRFAEQAYRQGYLPYRLWPWNPVEVGGLNWPGPINLRAAAECLRWRRRKPTALDYVRWSEVSHDWIEVSDRPRRLDRRELERILLRASHLRQLRHHSGADWADGGMWV